MERNKQIQAATQEKHPFATFIDSELITSQMLSVKGGNGGGDDEDVQDDGYV